MVSGSFQVFYPVYLVEALHYFAHEFTTSIHQNG